MIIQTTDLKSDIRAILINHSGRDNAITGIEIAHKVGMKENRAVRRTIRELIKDGIPIASVTEPPAGYYIVTSREEVDHYLQHLRNLLIQDAKRRRDFRNCAMQHLENAGQGRLL